MKKYNLKRFLASLLAVLMLASVTGVSPAVFAEDSATSPDLVETSTDAPKEVLIKDNYTDEQVLSALANALLKDPTQVDANDLSWTYTCAVKGTYKVGLVPTTTDNTRAATVSVLKGDTQTVKDDPNTIWPHKYDSTYTYPSLKDNADGVYTLYLNDEAVYINKVEQYATNLVLKNNATITYNKDAANMKQQIFDNAIDWENSKLPAKESLSISDFTFEYETLPSDFEGVDVNSEFFKTIIDSTKAFVPIEGEQKGITLFGKFIGLTYSQMGADEENYQVIKVKFNGSEDYKACENQGNLMVEKADVKVTINEPIKFMKAGEKIDAATYVSTDPIDEALDIYIVYVGVNTNKQTTIYLQVTGEKETFVNGVNALLKKFDLPTLNDGMTVGEVKDLLNQALAKVDTPLTELIVNGMLKDYGLTYQNLKDLVEALNNIKIADNLLFAIGSPAHAGQYFATALAINDNYNTGVSTPGSVTVLKNLTGLKLTKNPILDSNDNKITVSQAKQLAENNNLCILTKSGDALDSTSTGSIHYWFTGMGKIYAKSTMPTAPGKYIVTATVRGGDFFAMPKTFIFTIVDDPTPEVTPEA